MGDGTSRGAPAAAWGDKDSRGPKQRHTVDSCTLHAVIAAEDQGLLAGTPPEAAVETDEDDYDSPSKQTPYPISQKVTACASFTRQDLSLLLISGNN
ncbi:UNVERIFIED_CONTAM: hypothetical protein FKN15_043054 [Acipenser sinensis]